MDLKNKVVILNLHPEFGKMVKSFESEEDSPGWIFRVLEETVHGLWVQKQILGLSIKFLGEKGGAEPVELANSNNVYPVLISWHYILSVVVVSEFPVRLEKEGKPCGLRPRTI